MPKIEIPHKYESPLTCGECPDARTFSTGGCIHIECPYVNGLQNESTRCKIGRKRR